MSPGWPFVERPGPAADRSRAFMSEAARLVLVRHAQASLGSEDYDRLSERGLRQAGRVAERLQASPALDDVFWSGTLRRHAQTLAPLDPPERALRRTCDLDEFSTAGLVRAALARARQGGMAVPPRHQLADPARHLPALLDWFPGVLAAWQAGRLDESYAGSWTGFRERVTRARPDWESSVAAGQRVVVVTSAGVIATVMAELTGRSLEWQRSLAVRLYNASVSELVPEAGQWRLARCNCTRHLGAEGLRTLA